MTKVKRWQVYLIIFISLLTVYNTLPTIFYYSKPLKKPIGAKEAKYVEKEICSRLNDVEKETRAWVETFCKSINVKAKSIQQDEKVPAKLFLSFHKEKDADFFRSHFPAASRMKSHAPERLFLRKKKDAAPTEVVLERTFASFPKEGLQGYAEFSLKQEGENSSSSLYQKIIKDRVSRILYAMLNLPLKTETLASPLENTPLQKKEALLLSVAASIEEYKSAFGKDSPITKRRLEALQKPFTLKEKTAQLTKEMRSFFAKLTKEKKENIEDKSSASLLEKNVEEKIHLVQDALLLLEKNNSMPQKNSFFSSAEELMENAVWQGPVQISLKDMHPFIKEIAISWEDDRLYFILHEDAHAILLDNPPHMENNSSPGMALFLQEISRIAGTSSENIEKHGGRFEIRLSALEDSRSLLALDLWKIADEEIRLLEDALLSWSPSHPELKRDAFPIFSSALPDFSSGKGRLGISLLHPRDRQSLFPNLPPRTISAVVRGISELLEKYEEAKDSPEARMLVEDIQELQRLFQERGFVCYLGEKLPVGEEFSSDLFFENARYFSPFLLATEEKFQVAGSGRYAILELKDIEQRTLTLNQIETAKQERLLEEKETYQKALLSLADAKHVPFPAPGKNLFWNNMKLSAAKYFRGDERKILRWGLDLSGGKSVTLSLHDKKGKQVTDPLDLDKGIQELEKRMNYLGVAEIAIRREGANLVVDFPGSQNLSAEELIQGSSMFFHVMQEKFSYHHPKLAKDVYAFLEAVWNEATITGKKSPSELQKIGCKHLYGDALDTTNPAPKSAAAKILYDEGLRLATPDAKEADASFTTALSKIAILREEKKHRQGTLPPLCIVFYHYALKGSHLTDIQPSYDPNHGNFLRFSVKSSYKDPKGTSVYPKEDLYAWTSHFAREKVLGTPLEEYTRGQGYRMCVLLNDAIISAPTLDAPIREQAMISGNFSQKEVAALASDLKAGSLSYTPKILSETNVSPELGKKERSQGLLAVLFALFLVIAFMSGYYRFAGVIASVAVLFNLLMIWAILQNLQAALTLPGIAGIILTLGMAVDANVLVFERMKEEFLLGKKLKAVIQAGYEKAFSAIFDANITTIIAAVILFNFDAGPIKAFAITLIIGIASSMFSALFMTRVFFTFWAERNQNAHLSMSHFIQVRSFPFLQKAPAVFAFSATICILGLGCSYLQQGSLLGMDFTGGDSVHVRFLPKEEISYQESVQKALLEEGLSQKDFQVRSLDKNHHARILLSSNFTAPSTIDPETSFYKEFPFARNPKLLWLAHTLEKSNLPLDPSYLSSLHLSFSSMSAQFSAHVKNEAFMAVFFAFIGIFIYLGLRFEYTYALSAVFCLFHDVAVSLGLISFLRYLGLPLQIDLHAVAALLTIIGYSLNDTIIVFDRIREEREKENTPCTTILINKAVSDTFSRTMMTSITTLISLSTLVFLGGSSIFNFSFIMSMGVIFGTLSSLFIAGPLLLFFQRAFALSSEK